ncbi:MAG TPA: phosphoribosylformylglycinamidine synthase subunit PurL, partial [Saprospiraceae bacterium]|nr:phosphoribosylformylglycinamidine synthase subunit PurL [Saprospiraceae bacterium]
GCAFKIESHNHPSAIEPYQGAATGVGGIHRDIFTMGARPIAALNSLRFGDISLPHTQRLVKGVVSGIGGYGNCLGVPTIGGEVYFDACYNQNILVNAMSIGTVKKGETVSARADGPGNPVFIVGSATGKDGIHGATFASADLTENSAEDLPAVQVGDPFQEKLLLEASLEAIQTGAIVGMQDMGAAGITCSTSEMSAKSATGMVIDLDKVPTRQSNMQAFEILLSESQERMLIVCHKGQEDKLMAVFDKWDLECEEIGYVTDTGMLEFFHHGEMVAHVPAEPLVLGGGAPVYDRAYTKPNYIDNLQDYNSSNIPGPAQLQKTLEDVVSSPNLLSKRWIYEQYDSMVRTNTRTTNTASDAAVIRVKENGKGIAATVDCNSSYVYADPYQGAMIAVAEAARNLVCAGAEPLAVTNNLNFGNPYNEEVYWQFVNAVKGMGDACRKFNTPVTGGNVSFYNQSVLKDKIEPIYPTPTIGMIGLINDQSLFRSLSFQHEGDCLFLIGKTSDDLNQSEYIKRVFNIKESKCPRFDLEEEYHLQQVIKKVIRNTRVSSVHDIAEGGLFMNLLESGFENGKGFEIANPTKLRDDVFLLSESQSRVVVSIAPEFKNSLTDLLAQSDVEFVELGRVTGSEIVLGSTSLGSIEDWKNTYDHKLGQLIEA